MRDEANYWQRAMARRISRRGVLVAGVGAALGLAGGSLGGCSQPQTQEQTKTGATPAAKQPKSGGVYRIKAHSDPPHLDPHWNNNAGPTQVYSKIYNRLVKWNTDEGADFGSMDIVPDLAEKWEQTDPVTVVFNLRKGVKFQNLPPVNGRELGAEDVKWSFDRIRDPKATNPLASMYKGIKSVDVVDKYTVRMVLNEPYASFWNSVAHFYEPWIAPKEIVDKDGDLKKTCIGTGPFIFDSWEHNVKIEVKRNPDYFMKGRPYLDTFALLNIPDASTFEAAYLTGQVDRGSAGSKADLERITKAVPDSQVTQGLPPGNQSGLAFSQKSEPFKNLKVRQAVRSTIDYQRFIDVAFQGQGAMQGFYPIAFKQYWLPEDELKRNYKLDLPKAKQLMAEAGYPNGFKTTLLAAKEFNMGSQAQVIMQDLKQIGIDAEFQTVPFAEIVQRWANRSYDIYIGSLRTGPDPSDFTLLAYHTKGGKNYTGFSDPKMDALAEKQDKQMNAAERKQTILEIQRLAEELVPEVMLPANLGSYVLHRGYIKGFVYTHAELYDHSNIANMWIDK